MGVAPLRSSSATQQFALHVIHPRARLAARTSLRPRSPGAAHTRAGALLGALLSLAPAARVIAAPASASSAAAVFAAPAQAALPGPAGGALRVAVALALVVGAIFAAGWFSRRMHATRGTRHPGLEVLAQLPLGPRERAVLIRVGVQQLLVGVAGGCIRTLHVCEPGAPAASAAAAAAAAADGTDAADSADRAGSAAGAPRPSFRALLLKSLGK